MTPTYTREINYDRITRDFALYLNGELVGYAPSYLDGEVALDAMVYELLSREPHAPAPAPDDGYAAALAACEPSAEDCAAAQCAASEIEAAMELLPVALAAPQVIYATPALTPALLDSVLLRRLEDAQREVGYAIRCDDNDALTHATAQVAGLTRARTALALAVRARRLLATQTRTGDWVVVGSRGNHYTVQVSPFGLECNCPHGMQLRAWATGELPDPPRGVCWHTVLVSALEAAQQEAVFARDSVAA